MCRAHARNYSRLRNILRGYRVLTEPLQDGQALAAIELVALSAWQGMRVVGIAGGAQKTAFVRDTRNADAALDYRAHDFEQVAM